MKKLLALLLLLAAPAFGATVTLSTGASCDYSIATFTPGGTFSFSCGDAPPPPVIIVPPPPVVVNPPPPPAPVVNCNDSGFWQAGRWSPGLVDAGGTVSTTFKVPAGKWQVLFGFDYPGGAVWITMDDGPGSYADVIWPTAPILPPGCHTLSMRFTRTYQGSVNINHTLIP